MEAVGKYDFEARGEEELSFKKGQTVKIMNPLDKGNFWKAEKDGREGNVPQNYLTLKDCVWFQTIESRERADSLLRNEKPGTFVVRDSVSTPGDFTLSVKHVDNVQHFKVLRDGAGKYFLWLVKFNSINELVTYHRTSSVSRSLQLFLKTGLNEASALKATAMYDFSAAEAGELTFKKGDVITVVEKTDANWWRGKVWSGPSGLFPATYVKVIE